MKQLAKALVAAWAMLAFSAGAMAQADAKSGAK
jgi:hypothetical protein